MTIEDSGEVVQGNAEVSVEAQPEQVAELQADTAEVVETLAQPEEATVKPEEATVQPEETTVLPEETAVPPEGATVENISVEATALDAATLHASTVETSSLESAAPETAAKRVDAQNPEAMPQGPQLTDAQKVGLLEALLLASGDPLPISRIEELLHCKKDDVLKLADTLKQAYSDEAHGLELVLVASKLQLRTKPLYADYVRQLIAVKPRKLSQAALETLAVIAYQQPVVKSEVDKIRGVDVAPTIKTLLERKLIKIIGYQASVGQPALYGTTEDFLSIFGLSALSELPSLRDLKALVKEPGEALEEGSESVEEDESLEASDSDSCDEATPVEGEELQPLAQ
jgi:segregation and condensation protein B